MTMFYSQQFHSAPITLSLDVAVIVEPRKHPSLIPIVEDMLLKLPINTKIHIFHGIDNVTFLEAKLHDSIKRKKIILTNLQVKNIDRTYYSNLLTTKHFWDQINGEHVLIFQTDSCLCSLPKSQIDYNWSRYLNYGYVGAPYRSPTSKESLPAPNSIVYQNGGFSLRRKSLMLKAIHDKKPGENTWPEDYWFSQKKKYITNPAPYYKAVEFSIEGLFIGQHPIGIHKPWAYLQTTQLNELRSICPEMETIFGK